MTFLHLKDDATLSLYATKFLDLVRISMDLTPRKTAAEKAFSALDAVHRLVAFGDNEGFVVYNHEETTAPHYLDLFADDDGLEMLQLYMSDALAFQRDGLSFSTAETSRNSFLGILCSQVLFGLPSDLLQAEAHILRQIAATFNGMNRFHVKFELVYCGVDDSDERFETSDISDYLLV